MALPATPSKVYDYPMEDAEPETDSQGMLLWSLTIDSFIGDDGELKFGYSTDQEVATSELVGALEVVKACILHEQFFPSEEEN